MEDVVQEYRTILKDLSTTMLGVCRESVGLVKRSDQAVGTHLTQRQEWDVYLEFLKILFNLVDRASLFYVPIQRQPEFMNGLEDHVSHELTTVLGTSLSSAQIDDQEIVVAIGQGPWPKVAGCMNGTRLCFQKTARNAMRFSSTQVNASPPGPARPTTGHPVGGHALHQCGDSSGDGAL